MQATSGRWDAQQVVDYLREHRNWGRWGWDDERGTVNLIDADKRLEAVRTIRTGSSLSLARPYLDEHADTERARPGEGETPSFINYGSLTWHKHDTHHGGGASYDWLSITPHGHSVTHLDALGHMWNQDGLYNGKSPETITAAGLTFGAVDVWRDGIVTRGVLLDVPRHRGVSYVEYDEPVTGEELERLVTDGGIQLSPGDAVCVYSGREEWQAAHPDQQYGGWVGPSGRVEYPGLDASCLQFLRERDVSVLIWDMLDRQPDGYAMGVASTVHSALYAFGLPLVDNALLQPLAETCRSQDRVDFMLVIAPLNLPFASGCVVNPLAIL